MKVTLVGMGMQGGMHLTQQAKQALGAAGAIVGAPRLLQALGAEYTALRIEAATPEKVAAAIGQYGGQGPVCVALSGDVGFYSGAKKLARLLAPHGVQALPGIASPQYLAARLLRPWQGFHLVSAHAAGCNVLAEVLNHPEVFFLTGGGETPGSICRALCAAGLAGARVTVGQRLGYPDEQITQGTAEKLCMQQFDALSVVLVDNDKTFTRPKTAPGIADEAFVRGNVPMTKREVRAVALALLAPGEHEVLWDVGAGTGSVAVELALQARRGRVYAIERKAEACALIEKNRQAFGAYNLAVVQGAAPEALAALPAAHAAFVGGSAGQMQAVLRTLLEKNSAVRVVASAIALETLHAARTAMEALAMRDIEVVQLAASRAEKTAGYHMLRAQNPVFLISGQGGGGHG